MLPDRGLEEGPLPHRGLIDTWQGRRMSETSEDVTAQPPQAQFEAFLDQHRSALAGCLDGLTEEQARRSLVPSRTSASPSRSR